MGGYSGKSGGKTGNHVSQHAESSLSGHDGFAVGEEAIIQLPRKGKGVLGTAVVERESCRRGAGFHHKTPVVCMFPAGKIEVGLSPEQPPAGWDG